ALSEALISLQQTQTQLIQSEKMSSLGQVAAGVAHEINNPINFIHGNLHYVEQYMSALATALQLYQQQVCELPCELSAEVQQCLEDLDLDFIQQDLPKVLQSIRHGSDRITEIVRGLRHFSQLDEAVLKQADLHHGLESTLLLLQHRLKASSFRPAIQIIKDYGALPDVECYVGQMNQVFLNLLSNAIDAIDLQFKQQRSQPYLEMPTIIIQTGLAQAFPSTPVNSRENASKARAEESITIRIIDNGVGIPETVGNKIFDPFFTTKPIGQGTGLGLAVTYQIIVEQHRGLIQYHPHSSGGTELIVTIPLRHRAIAIHHAGRVGEAEVITPN
ncbi:MAG: ATP-binding protein, partial [Synechococcales bacterium]|nr:ATP-binding protein [Synechococcales bacterium]